MTAATGKPRGRPKGLPKSGGRVAGKSLDRQARQLVGSELAGSILETFQRLGGVDDMVAWAANNRTTFYTQVLARLYPAPQKSDDESGGNSQFNQFNFNQQDSFEAARKIAFVLARGVNADPSLAPIIDITPKTVEPVTPHQDAYHAPPAERVQVHQPEPVEDPNKRRWIEELPLSDEQRRDRDLIRETREPLESYHGSSAEHGRGPVQRESNRKPSAGELCRRLSRRGRDLL